MDLSNVQPIFKRFENELLMESYFSKLSLSGGKKVDIITIYPKGSYVFAWFYYDRNKIGYKKPEIDGQEKSAKAIKKKTRKKASKKAS